MKTLRSSLILLFLSCLLGPVTNANPSNLNLRCEQVGVSGPGGTRYLDVSVNKSTNLVESVQELHAGRDITVSGNASCDRENFVNYDTSIECSGTMKPTDQTIKPYEFSLLLGRDLRNSYVGAFSFDNSKTKNRVTPLWVYQCEEQ